MTIEKELFTIAEKWTEPEYRARPELSQSTLGTFERLGFSGLDHLFDKVESPALTLGSIVDTLMTCSQTDFDREYYVADFPTLGEKEAKIADYLFEGFGSTCISLSFIPFKNILEAANLYDFYRNWKDETRVKAITERCSYYYGLKAQAGSKKVISKSMYTDAYNMVTALRESPTTSWYFVPDDPFSPIRRYYQLKFKFTHNNVGYRSMLDLVLVDYENKWIYPIDLKTTGHPEWEFEDSFIKWKYSIQARLYWRNLRANLDKDPYFKDFYLANYKFIVVNKNTLTPLVWEFPLTQYEGTLVDEFGNKYRDPYDLGEELKGYLDLKPSVPKGIVQDKANIIKCLRVEQKEESNV